RSNGLGDLNGVIYLWIFGPPEIDLSYGRKLMANSSGITSPFFPGDTVIGSGIVGINADVASTADISIYGTVEVPEPATFFLVAPTLAGVCYKRRLFRT